MIGEVDQKLSQSLVLKDGGEVLVGHHKLRHELCSELTSGNRSEVVDVNIGNSPVEEYLPLVHET